MWFKHVTKCTTLTASVTIAWGRNVQSVLWWQLLDLLEKLRESDALGTRVQCCIEKSCLSLIRIRETIVFRRCTVAKVYIACIQSRLEAERAEMRLHFFGKSVFAFAKSAHILIFMLGVSNRVMVHKGRVSDRLAIMLFLKSRTNERRRAFISGWAQRGIVGDEHTGEHQFRCAVAALWYYRNRRYWKEEICEDENDLSSS